MQTIQPAAMPAPETLIDYGKGVLGVAMFHYAAEGQSLKDIASDCGFDLQTLEIGDDALDERLADAWADDDDGLLELWKPTPPEGWRIGAKFDTEDGPVAIFIRKREKGAS